VGKYNVSINGKSVQYPSNGDTVISMNGETVIVPPDKNGKKPEITMSFGESGNSIEVRSGGSQHKK